MCGFAFQVVRYDGQRENIVMYRGANAIDLFFSYPSLAASYINNTFEKHKKFKPTLEQAKQYNSTTNDWLCGNNLTTKWVDYCILTGKYRGAAHENFMRRVRPTKATKIPIFIHNLRRYDSHLIKQKDA